VRPPFEIGSNACVGCATCVFICPTGAIKLEDVLANRSVHGWASDFEATACKICGDHYLAPEFAGEVEQLLEKRGV
jgi:bidirectional [NiFe] hydrogenase diaphorase subunit